MKAKILLLIDNVHMGLGHDGLASLARKMKVDVNRLEPGSLVMFLNRAKDKLKVVGHHGVVIGYLRMPKGRQIHLEALQWLPKTFSRDGGLDYDAALAKALETRLMRTGKVSVLEAYRAEQAAGLRA